VSAPIVYLGPSLPLERAKAVLPMADYRPPIKRGDLAEALAMKPPAIGMIDGQFRQQLAVSPKEILAALNAGVTVLGAASMGALRAVELAPHGMIGVGTIFRWFRQGRIVAEDEVAVVYNEASGKALSEPLVNIRYSLSQAVTAGAISRRTRRTLIDLARQQFFPNRSYPLLFKLATGRVPAEELEALQQWLAQHQPDLKAADALRLLHRLRRLPQLPMVAQQ